MAKLTKAEHRQELLDHGHHYLQSEPGRADRFVQQALWAVQLETTWSWRRRSESFDSDDVIEGLGRIEQVLRAGDGLPLVPVERSTLRDWYGDITTQGEAQYYWREGTSLGTYPVADGLTVVHFTELLWVDAAGTSYSATAASESAVPLAPESFTELIQLAAQVRAWRDIAQWEALEVTKALYTEELERLQSNDGRVQVDEHRMVRVTNPDWA